MMIDRDAYLARLGLTGDLAPDIASLRRIHQAHLLHVPFENLDIHLGRPIRLEPDAVFDKIVTRRRGGFCYELNSLLGLLLEDLGYRVTLLDARAVRDDGSLSLDFDHLVLQVHCPNEPDASKLARTGWLVDVGWGDGPSEPLRLDEPAEQRQGPRVWKISRQGDTLLLSEQYSADEWLKHYCFDLSPHSLVEFEPMCRYHQTSPASMFTHKRLCTLYTPDGRVTLTGTRLVTTRMGDGPREAWQKEERELLDETEYNGILKQVFGVTI
jgi:N-hydroxyarylamine O-acetyltransferase